MSDTPDRPAPPTAMTARPLAQCRTLSEVFQTDEFKRRVSAAKPSHMKMDAILNSFIQATGRTPDLLKCDLRQAIGGFLTLSELGLPLTPALGMAHMIPFKGRVLNRKTNRWEDGYNLQIIIGYQGYIELAMRTGQVGGIHADIVYPEDKQFGLWEYEFGTRQDLRHRPAENRGPASKPTHAYCIAHLRNDTMPPFEVYPYSKVLGIRDRSQGYLKALHAKQEAIGQGRAVPRTWTDAPWVRDEEAMAKKTMIRAAQKMWPKSAELQSAEAVDDPERGYVDFGPIVDAQPGDVRAVDLPVEEEPGDPGAAFGVRTQPSEPPQQQERQVAAPKPTASKAAPSKPKATPAPEPEASADDAPSADPGDYGLGAIPQTFEDQRQAQQDLPAAVSDFGFYVIDEVGEAVSDEISDPAKWAATFRNVYDAADQAGRNQIIDNNMDALAAAHPFASETLRDVMKRPEPAKPAAVMQPAAVPIPLGRSGKQDWIAYLKAVREVLPHLGSTIPAEAWVLAQIPVLSECPHAQRLLLIGDISKRMGEFGQRPPAALAVLVQTSPRDAERAAPPADLLDDPDRAWISKMKGDVDRCVTLPQLKALVSQEHVMDTLREMKERKSDLVENFKAYAEARQASLKATQA